MRSRLIAFGMAFGVLGLCVFTQLGPAILAFMEPFLMLFGIRKPRLLLVPASLILAWILLDALAVVVGLWWKDRERARRLAMRQRLMAEEFRVPGRGQRNDSERDSRSAGEL